MADAPSTPATPSPVGGRATILIFAFVAVLLAAAIGVVAITQMGTAAAAQSAATAVRVDGQEVRMELERLRREVAALRQDAQARNRVLTDLAARVQTDLSRTTEGLQAVQDTQKRLQEELAGLRTDIAPLRVRAGLPPTAPGGQEGIPAEVSAALRHELGEKLASLSERIETLKNEVVLKETRVLHEQVAEASTRLDQAARDVDALRAALREADLPALASRVQEADRKVTQAEAEVKAVARAVEAFKAQVTQFFEQVFYNDPWGKYAAQAPAGQP